MSRFVAASAAVAAGLLMSVAGASPASAATQDLSTNCDTPLHVTGNPGDTVVIHMGVGCTYDAGYRWYVWNINGTYVAEDVPAGSATASGFLTYVATSNAQSTGDSSVFGTDWWAESDGSGDTVVTAMIRSTDGAGNPLVNGSVLGNIYADGPAGSVNNPIYFQSVPDQAPPSWYQSVGRASVDVACETGWNPSWEQWPNGGQGGYVCSREQYYSLSTSEWLYRMAAGKSQPGR
jgi:hypothetical protein